jgi:hypothetical protein
MRLMLQTTLFRALYASLYNMYLHITNKVVWKVIISLDYEFFFFLTEYMSGNL